MAKGVKQLMSSQNKRTGSNAFFLWSRPVRICHSKAFSMDGKGSSAAAEMPSAWKKGGNDVDQQTDWSTEKYYD